MPRKGPEYQLQSQIAALAHLLGWESIAFRPLLTKRGYRTPGSGSMAKGWPDLTLVRVGDRRLIFAELKGSKAAKPSPDQERVLGVLRVLAGADALDVRIEVFVWRPSDWPDIERILR